MKTPNQGLSSHPNPKTGTGQPAFSPWPEISCFIILLLLIFSSVKIHAQELTYTIYKGNTRYGTMQVNRVINGSSVNYHLKAEVSINLIGQSVIVEEIKAAYKNGILVFASARRTVNTRVVSDSEIKLKDNRYLVTGNHQQEVTLDGIIRHSIVSIYFSEPVNHSEVYSETFRKFVSLKHTDRNVYAAKLPNGKQTIYRYQGGVCTEVESDMWFSKITFRLTELKAETEAHAANSDYQATVNIISAAAGGFK